MWDVVLLLLFPFQSQIFDAFSTSLRTYSHFALFYCNFCRFLCSKVFDLHLFCVISMFVKICYDKAGNLPNKGRNFNTQTWEKIVYFLFVWLVGIGFRQNFFRVLPNFGDFGAKMSFFHYIINQNRNNFIKHCSPPCTKKPLISEMCIYIKSSLCKWGLGTRGGTMFYRQKTKGVSA